MTLSLQLLWNYWSIYHKTWYVDRTSYGVMHISPHFCGSYAPWNLENIRKSTSLNFLCQFFINEITASDAGPDIIRSHLFFSSLRNESKKPNHKLYECRHQTAHFFLKAIFGIIKCTIRFFRNLKKLYSQCL